MISEQSKENPDIIRCPPMVFFGAWAAGLCLNWLYPLDAAARVSLRVTGGILGLVGIALGLWAVRALHKAGTAVRPNHPVTALVTDGPYRFTRNPLYVALTTIYVGMVLSSGILWLAVTLIPALIAVHWRIIRREEQFMEARFGDAYCAYKSRVRRWL